MFLEKLLQYHKSILYHDLIQTNCLNRKLGYLYIFHKCKTNVLLVLCNSRDISVWLYRFKFASSPNVRCPKISVSLKLTVVSGLVCESLIKVGLPVVLLPLIITEPEPAHLNLQARLYITNTF